MTPAPEGLPVLTIVGLLTASAHAATLQVGPTATYQTVQAAIDAAEPGDTIAVAAGTYTESLVILDKTITLEGSAGAVLQGSTASTLDITTSTVELRQLTIRPLAGRGIHIRGGSVTLQDLVLEDTTLPSGQGAGIYAQDGAQVVVSAVTFDRLSTTDGGGAIAIEGGDLTIDNSDFLTCSSRRGGAIEHDGEGLLSIQSSRFIDNHATDRGGAVWLGGDVEATLADAQFSGNTSDTIGGAIAWETTSTAPLLSVAQCTFEDNSAALQGGALGLDTAGSFHLLGSTLDTNQSANGGAVSVFGAAELLATGNTLCGNRASSSGGAFRLEQVGPSTFENNALYEHVSSGAGGVWWLGQSGLTTLKQNTVVGSLGTSGAAVWSTDTTAELRNNVFAYSGGSWSLESDAFDAFDLAHNAWFANAQGHVLGGVGPGAVLADPLLMDYTPDGLCPDDGRLRTGSPLIDAGTPATLDPDGTVSDIGAFGGPSATAAFQDQDLDGVVDAYDCEESIPSIFPGANEVCNGQDTDCDGAVDSPNAAGASAWYRDDDRDGYGVTSSGVVVCDQPSGWVILPGDCDDQRADIAPDAEEVCDGIDNDCSGSADGNDATDQLTWFADDDGDTYGSPLRSIGSCDQPDGYVLNPADCDDDDATINPDGVEVCDGADNDCEGTTDEGAADAIPWYIDRDGDGFGTDAQSPSPACQRPDGYARTPDDCDDTDPTTHPRAEESCSTGAADSNCDGFTGRDDQDGDGFPACDDCDDGDPGIYPGAPDTPYDGAVADCDSLSDFDSDRDGFDSVSYGGTDCDDTSALVYPGAEDLPGDGIDGNCDGEDLASAGPVAPDSGCGCAQGRPVPMAILTLMLVAFRRRGASRPTAP